MKAPKDKQARKHNGLYAFLSQIKVIWSGIKEIFPFPFVFSFLIMRTYAAKCNAEIWKKRFSWIISHELFLENQTWKLKSIEVNPLKPGQVYNPLPRLYISFLTQPLLDIRRNALASVDSLKANCSERYLVHDLIAYEKLLSLRFILCMAGFSL